MKSLKKIIVVILCLITSLVVGLLNSHNYIKSAENKASIAISKILENREENICYKAPIDFSLTSMEAIVETDKAAYYFVIDTTNFWINFTFLNLLLSPTVEVRVMEEFELEESKCMGR